MRVCDITIMQNAVSFSVHQAGFGDQQKDLEKGVTKCGPSIDMRPPQATARASINLKCLPHWCLPLGTPSSCNLSSSYHFVFSPQCLRSSVILRHYGEKMGASLFLYSFSLFSPPKPIVSGMLYGKNDGS